MAGSTFSRVKTWIAEILTHTDLNAEFDNILTNFTPAGMDDASATDAAMQTATDPYPAAAISKPTDLTGEIQRLRYLVKQITGETYWYVDPDIDLSVLDLQHDTTGKHPLAGFQGTMYALDAAGSDTYAVTLDPVPAALFNGMVLNVKVATANTGACTLNPNSLGAIAIKKNHDQDPVTGDIEANQILTLVYNSTGPKFQMQSQIGRVEATVGFRGTQFLFPGWFNRSKLTWSTTSAILLDAGAYMVKDKFAYWVTQITESFSTPGVSDWVYIYLDYSAITSGTALTATEIISSTTEPAFNTTYQQWMNGDDRCIGAVLTDASQNIVEFFHDGDLVLFADEISVDVDRNVATTFANIGAFTMPIFARSCLATFYWKYVDAASVLYYRTDGQTGATGHRVGIVNGGATDVINTLRVVTSSGHLIELEESAASANTATTLQSGWYLPIGM